PISPNARSTSSCEETSMTMPRPPISAATDSTSSRVRAVTTTSKPSPARARAIDAPIPRPPPVTTAVSGNGGLDRLEGLGVLERRQVARVGAERLRLHGAADDLRRARLRQRVDEEDTVRPERLAELRRDVRGDLVLGRRCAGQQAAEDPRRLALHGVRHADRGRLAHR